MTALIVDLAAAIVSDLNAATFSLAFTATRAYRPTFELADLDTLRVVVVPRGIMIKPANRAGQSHNYTIDIGILKRLGDDANATIDPYLTLAEEIADAGRGTHYPALGALWSSTQNDPIYDADYLEQSRQFTTVVSHTYEAFR